MPKDLDTKHNNDRLIPQHVNNAEDFFRLTEKVSTDNMELWSLELLGEYLVIHSPFKRHKVTLPKQEFDLIVEWYQKEQEVIT